MTGEQLGLETEIPTGIIDTENHIVLATEYYPRGSRLERDHPYQTTEDYNPKPDEWYEALIIMTYETKDEAIRGHHNLARFMMSSPDKYKNMFEDFDALRKIAEQHNGV